MSNKSVSIEVDSNNKIMLNLRVIYGELSKLIFDLDELYHNFFRTHKRDPKIIDSDYFLSQREILKACLDNMECSKDILSALKTESNSQLIHDYILLSEDIFRYITEDLNKYDLGRPKQFLRSLRAEGIKIGNSLLPDSPFNFDYYDVCKCIKDVKSLDVDTLEDYSVNHLRKHKDYLLEMMNEFS